MQNNFIRYISRYLNISVRFVRNSRVAWQKTKQSYDQEVAKQNALRIREKAFQAYFGNHHSFKLQIGAGTNLLDGWLNTDVVTGSEKVFYLDALEPYPFEDQVFDYIFSEHMIEHIRYTDGLFMLSECFRILKPGGKIRIATPDIKKIVGLYNDEKSEIQKRYLEWSSKDHLGLYSPEISEMQKYHAELAIDYKHMGNRFPDPSQDSVCFVVNSFFRSYMHQFIYDAKTLKVALQEAGFENIVRLSPGESNDRNLQGLESHGKIIGDEMNRFETMVLEAMRR